MRGADDHSGSTPAVLSATHHQVDDTLRFMAAALNQAVILVD